MKAWLTPQPKITRENIITIPGRPMPAVRMTRKGKWKSPNAQKYLAFKDSVGWAAKAARVERFVGPVAIFITVFVAGNQAGDWDNYGKSICDGLNGIAYLDDRQIQIGIVAKVKVERKEEQKTIVRIGETE